MNEIQSNTLTIILSEKGEKLRALKKEQEDTQRKIEELYDTDTQIKFKIQILENEIKSLLDMK